MKKICIDVFLEQIANSMTDDGGARVSSDETQTRQRKKRKWDQPAESFVAAAAAGRLIVPGILPLNNLGSLASVMVPGTSPLTTTLLASPSVSSSTILSPLIPVASAVQQSSMVNSKLNQVKIQEDLVIAREIVINDAEPSLRYRLTKRQTQEEILNRTGAVVITRGKYRPPNTPSDEKPLYLHISAAAHLKETVERIVAVDRAAAMIDDMMKQGPNFQFPLPSVPMTNGVQSGQSLNLCIYLGFDVDPSWNIAARIRGPNDLYISHIMNETGATVLLKGRGSGAFEAPHGEGDQPLHLFLSSNNHKSLDDAKRLAENLLDTISAEYGASRVSSTKVYGAVPPPPQLLPATEVACKPHMNIASAESSSSVGPISAPSISSSGLPNIGNYIQPSLTGGTSYRGYEGIYPQVTPLQQVALALKQSPSVSSSIVPTATTSGSVAAKSSISSVPEKEKKPPQRRKFQELPVGPSVSTKLTQGLEWVNPDTVARDLLTVPPKRLVPSLSNRNLPPSPPYKSSPELPSPPKLTSAKPNPEVMSEKIDGLKETRPDPVPDTLLKLVEYGEEDDDPDETVQDSSTPKPFWAV